LGKLYCQICGSPLDASGHCPSFHGETILPVSADISIDCPICNSINNLNATYCWKCGKKIEKKEKFTNISPEAISALKLAMEAIKKRSTGRENYIMTENTSETSKSHQTDNRVHIALWGPKNAGKTVFLLSLYLAAQQKNSDWAIGFDDAPAELRTKFIGDANSLRKGVWPNPTLKNDMFIYKMLFYPSQQEKVEISTPPEDPFERFINFFTKEPQPGGKVKKEILTGLSIEFADVAGERYLEEQMDSPLWEHLVNCNALICLLDPDALDDQLLLTSNLVENMFAKYRNKPGNQLIDGRYLPHYISVCFTKMDRDPWSRYLHDENPESLVEYLSDQQDLDLGKQL
jgi:hypothetical protein